MVAERPFGGLRIIGLLGGVASGKSLVAKLLNERGAGVLDADRVGHEVLESREVKSALVRRWGGGILRPDGQLDRSAVARKVFAPPPGGLRDRAFLEQLVHPIIETRLADQARRMVADGKRVAILDAALLLEAGWERFCDGLLFVESTTGDRLRRAQDRGWTDGEYFARENAQLPLESKRSRANWIIDNAGSKDDLRAQIERLWPYLANFAD